MTDVVIEYIRDLVSSYGAWGVFIISVLEEVIAPIPSTLTIMAAGFFLLPAHLSLSEAIIRNTFVIALPAAAGVTLGSLFVYGITYWGGKPLIEFWGKYFGISWSSIEKTKNYFTKGYADEVIILGLRAVPLFPNSALSAFCGLVRYPPRMFIVITLIGTIFRAFVMGLVGWKVGEAYYEHAAYLNRIENTILQLLILAVVMTIIYLISRKYLHKRGS